MKINELYFGVCVPELGCSAHDKRIKMRAYNLFGSARVLLSIATWITMAEKERREHDFLFWCFNDVANRCEYEWVICPWGGLDENDKVTEVGKKVDVYQMYVKPNEKLLREMVDQVSVTSAKEFIRKERRRWQRNTK